MCGSAGRGLDAVGKERSGSFENRDVAAHTPIASMLCPPGRRRARQAELSDVRGGPVTPEHRRSSPARSHRSDRVSRYEEGAIIDAESKTPQCDEDLPRWRRPRARAARRIQSGAGTHDVALRNGAVDARSMHWRCG